MRTWIALALACIVACKATLVPSLRGEDWPMWRHDPGHGASTVEEPPDAPALRWSEELGSPRPAWPASQPWLRYDASYAPVAAGGLLFVPSMVADRVTACDLATGRHLWSFYADGPVRFAPLVSGGKLYFGSDDGYLYCLDAAKGGLLWRTRGGPYARNILGNDRLISTWPVRGAPVLHGGRIYFASGIWPFMGIFMRAVDPESGRVLWTNSGEGATYTVQPHNSPAFSGFVPHGYLAATRQGIVAPGGRTQPGCYDPADGKLRYFEFGLKNSGDFDVLACDDWYISCGQMIRIADGKPILATMASVCDGKALYGIEGGMLFCQSQRPEKSRTTGVKPTAPGKEPRLRNPKTLWKVPLPEEARGQLLAKAGGTFLIGGKRRLLLVRAAPDEGRATIAWRADLDADPWMALVADRHIVVVTTGGRLSCFGMASPGAFGENRGRESPSAETLPIVAGEETKKILAQAPRREGYAMVLGLDRPKLVEELVRGSRFHWIALDADPQRIDALRRRMDSLRLYGTRLAAKADDPAAAAMPPYLAELVVVPERPAQSADQTGAILLAAFRMLRPYGGTALFLGQSANRLRTLAASQGLSGAEVRECEGGAVLVRGGALPGAADWTHQYADSANTVCSADQLVKAPLGLLWFGGPPNDEVLPRHGHGPSPQVCGGRLFIEGPDMLRAVDIYTGRLLWQKTLPALGTYYNRTTHQPGANAIGSNFATIGDRVYVVDGGSVLEMDAGDGGLRREIRLKPGATGAPCFGGFVAVDENHLVVTAGNTRYAMDSPRLIVYDRATGQKLWERQAKYAFRHNAIVVGSGRIFCIDGRPKRTFRLFESIGCGLLKFVPSAARLRLESSEEGKSPLPGTPPARESPDYKPRLVALDIRSGNEIWNAEKDVFGTFLGYSAEYDALLETGSANRDRPLDEADKGMLVFRASDGKILWSDLDRPCAGPCILHHDTIIAQTKAYRLLTGEPKSRTNPLTGKPMPWEIRRNYGCNTIIGSEHLLTFRSAAAGFYDLRCDGGTGNLGGFKSGCTSNLIAAGGLLNAPDYTRTCTCRYQNQTSLAMLYDPRAEIWTFNPFTWDGGRVRRVGINFGAPGDRLSDSGTLWLDWPSRGGPSPDLPIEVEPRDPVCFRQHSSMVRAGRGESGLSWVAASGIRDVASVTLTLCRTQAPPRTYTVGLHFVEPDDVQPGQRVFAIRLQGRQVAAAVDIAREAGSWTAVVKRFRGILVADRLNVSLEAQAGSRHRPVLCGIEAVLEEP